jgi:hypothetical protein
MDRENNLKSKVQFKLELQEIALRETKFVYKKNLEQTNMMLAEAESKLFQLFKGDN